MLGAFSEYPVPFRAWDQPTQPFNRLHQRRQVLNITRKLYPRRGLRRALNLFSRDQHLWLRTSTRFQEVRMRQAWQPPTHPRRRPEEGFANAPPICYPEQMRASKLQKIILNKSGPPGDIARYAGFSHMILSYFDSDSAHSCRWRVSFFG